jgi:hypothetical protein
MKALLILILLPVLAIIASCTKEGKEKDSSSANYLDSLVVNHSFKGWELYSWPESDKWHFSILMGTNRIKSYEEVTSNTPNVVQLVHVIGIDSLKNALDQFPANEDITWLGATWLKNSWSGNYRNLQLPPKGIIDEISGYCGEKGLKLHLTE